MKKLITAIVMAMCIAIGAIGLSSCSNGGESTSDIVVPTGLTGTVTADGSSALLPLAQAAADLLKDANPNISITVNGGGSGTGIKDVAAGKVDIGNSDLFAEEKTDAVTAATLVDHKVCIVVMAPIVNPEVTVASLTTAQLIQIFTGAVTNWKDVGGSDMNIVLCTRPSSSGTRALFTKYALNGNSETAGAFESDNSGELLTKVKETKGAIGYMALSYLTDLSKAGVKKVKLNGVDASNENAYSGTYSVWGYEHMYTKGEATGLAKDFIEFMQGTEFGKKIEELGYGVSSKLTNTAINSHK